MKVSSAESVQSSWLRSTLGACFQRLQAADAHKGLMSVVDQGVVSATAFLSAILLARHTSPAELGLYTVALNALALTMAVQGELVSSPFTIYSPRKKGADLAQYAGSMIIHQCVLTLLSIALLISVIGFLVGGIGPGELVGPLSVLILVAPFILFRAFIRQFSFAQLRNLPLVVALDLGICVVQLALIGLLIEFERLAASPIYVVMGATCLIACVIWSMVQKQPLKFGIRRAISDWKFNWKFARWGLAGTLAGCSMPLILPGVLLILYGSSATGVLAASFGIVGLCNTFVVGVANFLTAKSAQEFERHGKRGLKRVLVVSVAVFLATLGTFAAFLLITGDWLLVTIYGGDYKGTAITTIVLVFASLANSLAVVAGNGLYAIERPRANLYADLATMMPTLALTVALIPYYQGLAIAVALCGGNLIGAAIRWETLRRCLKSIPPSSDEEVGIETS